MSCFVQIFDIQVNLSNDNSLHLSCIGSVLTPTLNYVNHTGRNKSHKSGLQNNC